MPVDKSGSEVRFISDSKQNNDSQGQISTETDGCSGLYLNKTVHLERSNRSVLHWSELKGKLDSLVEKQNKKGFDETFMRHLKSYLRHQKIANSTKHKRTVYTLELRQRFMPEALYALKTIFSVNHDGERSMPSSPMQPNLRITFFPKGTFGWLVHGNYLTPELLTQALQTGKPRSSIIPIIGTGEIIKAIIAHDSTLSALDILLENSQLLSAIDTILAIKVLITATEIETSQDIFGFNDDDYSGCQNLESEMSRQEEAACSDIARGLASLEAGSDMRGRMLYRALTRLHSFSSSNISQYLREYLTRYEIVALLQLLRTEITEGGWILRYTAFDISEIDNFTPDERAMSTILSLMSSVMNALGIAGWLMDSAEERHEDTGDLLLTLQVELSHVLEGITEATFMAGLLDEFLRYSSRKRIKPRYEETLQLEQQIELFQKTENTSTRKFNRSRLLPMDLGADSLAQDTRKGIRGELKKRSKRDIGMQLSMKRRRYSRDVIQV